MIVVKLGCTRRRYEQAAIAKGNEAGIDVKLLLAGSRLNEITKVRWTVWRELAAAGFSYFSIGKACGFDHTSVRYACIRQTDPCMGRNRGTAKIDAPEHDEMMMRRKWRAQAALTRVSGSAF